MTDRIPLQTVSPAPRLLTSGRDLFDHPKDAMPKHHRLGRSRYAYVTWDARDERWRIRVGSIYLGSFVALIDAVAAREAYFTGQGEDHDAA